MDAAMEVNSHAVADAILATTMNLSLTAVHTHRTARGWVTARAYASVVPDSTVLTDVSMS